MNNTTEQQPSEVTKAPSPSLEESKKDDASSTMMSTNYSMTVSTQMQEKQPSEATKVQSPSLEESKKDDSSTPMPTDDSMASLTQMQDQQPSEATKEATSPSLEPVAKKLRIE
jgi:hypothetical protein